jgi:hypothetical protein
MTSYIRAYSLGKRLSRAHFMEKHAEGNGGPSRPTSMSGPKPPLYTRSELSNKRTVDNGVAMPSMQERYDSARDLPTTNIKNMEKAIRSNYAAGGEIYPKKHHKILQDELYRRRHGGVGSFSRDLSTVQRDVDKLQEDVRNAYTPKVPQYPRYISYQDELPNQVPNFMSDTAPRKYQVGDLSEGLTFGRRPVNVVRPDTLRPPLDYSRNYRKAALQQAWDGYVKPDINDSMDNRRDVTQIGDPYTFPKYKRDDPGPMYAPNKSSLTTSDGRVDAITKEYKRFEGGQQVNPSAYVLRAKSDPRNPREGYTNPITAAHEYGHGEYDMDEVEADALAATTDYDMYDLADFYSMLTDYGENDASTEATYADHEARGDTHLPVAERTQLMADNVNPYK